MADIGSFGFGWTKVTNLRLGRDKVMGNLMKATEVDNQHGANGAGELSIPLYAPPSPRGTKPLSSGNDNKVLVLW